VAYVELLPGSTATPADLMAHATRLLAPYKRPSEIIVLDALPVASTGKILKHQLAVPARDRAIERV
jgi:long-chain acyl-CoA synthetase